MEQFIAFNKIPRLSRECIITEKIDGTNAQIYIYQDVDGNFNLQAASRTRYITVENDNFGFAKWCEENKQELLKLGLGRHYGEWWGEGIQRQYGIKGRRFSLFNIKRWTDNPEIPKCCHVVPVLDRCEFDTEFIYSALYKLESEGSVACPGFMRPEGVVIFHTASGQLFKKLIENDALPKGNKQV